MHRLPLSVVIPTHRPQPRRLEQLIQALAAQTMPGDRYEVILVDNASRPPVDAAALAPMTGRTTTHLVREEQLGLTYARLAGFQAAGGEWLILFDDDNVPEADYLEQALKFAAQHPGVGAFGGRSLPVHEISPPSWLGALGLSLGCRDLGAQEITFTPPANHRLTSYPACAPIGAGMVLHRGVAEQYREKIARTGGATITDRQGSSLGSGGDCEIVLTALRGGWGVAYTPSLTLQHHIPSQRFNFRYLARLSRQSNRSWVRLLGEYGISPWKPIHPATVGLRQLRAFVTMKAWQRPVPYIRWQGCCGMFEGQADLHRHRTRATPSPG
jgi:glycosyltransferase involved in cell wall biosynthesis